jgi:hypothetical protein
MAGKKKKVPERRSGFRPSEKEHPERRFDSFRHKNTPVHSQFQCIILLLTNDLFETNQLAAVNPRSYS